PSNSEKMSFSVADELIKYKELLDVGVISQEEFDKKKQQLLDID
ncbi:SHOCT domain-containing protein, partial [Staphylococcus aureus]